MSMYVLAIAMTIAASAAYHLLQRSIRPDISPAVSLIATYVTAIVVSLLAWPWLSNGGELGEEVRKLGWASFALGGAVVGLEAGFLLAYRAGWNVGVAALYSNAAVALVLLPVGMLAFKEGIDLRKACGLVLALAGLVLLSRRPES